MRGIGVSVLRDSELERKYGESSNGGVTAPENATDKFFVLFDEVFNDRYNRGNHVLAESQGNPNVVCLKVVRRDMGGGRYLHVEPMEQPEGMIGPMAGGCFVYSSDSRFRALSSYPLAVHDRFETSEQYALLSR